MFEFIKDAMLEARGIDTAAAREQRKEYRETEKTQRYLFKRKTKLFITVLSVLYIAAVLISLISGGLSASSLKDIGLCLLATGATALLWIAPSISGREKIFEIISACGIGVFLILLYIRIV